MSLEERVARYRPLVEQELREVVGDSDVELFAWMRYHLGWEDAGGNAAPAASGKLLRSSALLLTTELTGGAVEAALPAAAAIELVHNFSLLHDDVEDGSERRRGRATLWTFASVAHAINTGDGMFTLARLAMHRLLEAGVPERRAIEAMREFDESCLRLVEGQYLDIRFEGRSEVTRGEYLAMAAGKTAAMFGAPFAIGALLGGADGVTVAAFRRFGHHLGLAFQGVDDVLGIWGDPAVTGKPAGDDLRSRKMTYPVIAALEADGDEASLLARRYATPSGPEDDVSDLAELVASSGGRSATEAFAEEQRRTALEALGAAALSDDARALCAEYAGATVLRVA